MKTRHSRERRAGATAPLTRVANLDLRGMNIINSLEHPEHFRAFNQVIDEGFALGLTGEEILRYQVEAAESCGIALTLADNGDLLITRRPSIARCSSG